MDVIRLMKEQARHFILAHQRLRPPFGIEGKTGILDYIRHVGCIQFDPLDIVGRNPELVLQSRVDGFRPEMLRELLYGDRKLLDGWDKMMAIYLTGDLPYLLYRQREAAERSSRRNSEAITEVVPLVRRAIEERGPLSSIDLDYNRKVDWPWGPTRLAKAALENMYYAGELIIHHKVHTRRVYDLAHRHIPAEILDAPDPHRTQEEYHDWHFLRRIGSVGLLWDKHNAWHGIYGAGSSERTSALKRLVEQRKAVEVHVEGLKKVLYMRSEDTGELDQIAAADNPPQRAAILAPLDNLLWEREIIRQLFDFDYTWEVYKPAAERKYGYYVLPVLYGDCFVARFEPGRKKKGPLEIKNWWWEPGVEKTDGLRGALRDCFDRFLGYLGADDIIVEKALVKREGLDWLPVKKL